MTGPLAGLKVIDLTEDLGRFGTKLLSEAGADVVRAVGAGERGAPMADERAARLGGVLDWWFDGGKSLVDLDLATDRGRENYRQLAAHADLVIESIEPGALSAMGLDHDALLEANPTLTQVALTPYGRTGPKANWLSSDLVAGAEGGVLCLTGLPDEPLNSWGGQNHNFGGFAAVICGLAGVRSARRTGHGQLVDLSLHEVVTGSIENLFFQFFFDDVVDLPKEARRQGSLHWLGAYEVAPAASGHVMITPTPGAEPLIDWMVESGIDSAQQFVGKPVEELLAHMPELMASVKEFLLTRPAGDLFVEGQARHIAFGEVQTIAQAAANPQYEFRELFGDAEVDGAAVTMPSRLVRFDSTPVDRPRPPADASQPLSVDDILEGWQQSSERDSTIADGGRAGDNQRQDRTAKPLDGLRVLDLSWVLAGPFATRILGDLGADVIKVQHEGRATLVNLPEYPYYFVWNRSKRSATVDLKHPGALAAVRRLVEASDVLVENYSSGVLERLGLGWDTLREWNPRLVYVSMSGPGQHGPWKDVISYAPTIHALCGLTYLTNPTGRGDVGCGFSLNDHAAGFASVFSILAALESRERTGVGQYIDMAQLEIGTYLLGPAMVDYLSNGVEARPAGNRDGLAHRVPNGVYRASDDFVAITANDDDMWGRLAELVGLDPALTIAQRRSQEDALGVRLEAWVAERSADDVVTQLQGRRVAAGKVQDARQLFEHDEQHRARSFWHQGDHQLYETRPFDRFPALWSHAGDLSPYTLAPAFLGEANFEVWSETAGLEAEVVAEGIGDGLFT